MRRLDVDLKKALYQIRAFEEGRLLINDKEYNESIIVTPHKVIEGWGVPTIESLTASSLALILDLKPDVLLLGTGVKHHFIHPKIYSALLEQRIGVEVMSTSAACRTFNALTLDERHVVAALIIN